MTCFVLFPILVPLFIFSFFFDCFRYLKCIELNALKRMMAYALYLSHRQRDLFYFFVLLVPHSVSMADNIKPNQKGLFDLLFFNIISVLLLLWSLHSFVGVRSRVLFIETCHRIFFNTSPIFPSDTCARCELNALQWFDIISELYCYHMLLPLFRQLSDPISFSIQHDKYASFNLP